MEINLEQRSGLSYHYEFAGFTTFKEVLKLLDEKLPYFRIERAGKNLVTEIYYDVPSRVLTESGIVISKLIEKDKAHFNIRKLNLIKSIKKNRDEYLCCDCNVEDLPKDYAFKMASQILSFFSTPFSVDLEAIVRQTQPIIQVDNSYESYEIYGGSGFRGNFQYEDNTFIDLKTGNKIQRFGLTLNFPEGESEDSLEIMKIIEKYIKGLVLYEASRFEIARNLLFVSQTREGELDLLEENDDDEEEDNDEE